MAKELTKEQKVKKEEAIKWLKEILIIMESIRLKKQTAENVKDSYATRIADASPLIVDDDTSAEKIMDYYSDVSEYDSRKDEERFCGELLRELGRIDHKIRYAHNLCENDLKEQE